MLEKSLDATKTYAYQITEKAKEEGYIGVHLNLAKAYKQTAYTNRYKFEGYEDLELSTQILIKEAVKRGINTQITDRSDNFIELSKGHITEYVKQATKTSKDSYMTMLMMENKTVTKKVLEKHHICVPKGIELTKGQNPALAIGQYEKRPIVVKPKSTNFGTGISIFPEGTSKEDIAKALEIGFKYDDTVLIEEFAKGKEYRFLVIGDEVAGILHRVPANVEGDGIHSITELVEIKNQDPLRGKGYKTPLEKIRLDSSSGLFLKQRQLNFNYVPRTGEVVYLRENSNISTGGDSIDYTDSIPDKFKQIAVEAARAVGAKFCGVDMMLEDYASEESSYSIIELNFNPAIHIHCFPYKGKERNIGEKVLKVLELL
jgi:glutamate--cysteine ligase